MAYKKDGQNLDDIVCQIKDYSLPHAAESIQTQWFGVIPFQNPDSSRQCYVVQIPVSEFNYHPQSIQSVTSNTLSNFTLTNSSDDPGWTIDNNYVTIYFTASSYGETDIGVTYSCRHFKYGPTLDISRFLAYKMPFTKNVSGYKVNGNEVPLVKRGYAPYLENGHAVWHRSTTLTHTGNLDEVVDYTITRTPAGEVVLDKYVHKASETGVQEILDIHPIPDNYDMLSNAHYFYNLASSAHTPVSSSTLISADAPYLIYFEMCGGGGGSAASSTATSTGGGGGGSTICGLLDFSKYDSFWFRVGRGGLGGINYEGLADGKDGGFSAVLCPTSVSDDYVSYSAIMAGGGGGSFGSGEAGASGGWYLTGSGSTTYSVENGSLTYRSSYLQYLNCTVGYSNGIYVLSGVYGGNGGAVDNPGTAATCTSKFHNSIESLWKTCSGTGGANNVNGEAAWGGGGGASALGGGGSGARYNQTPVSPGYGGGGGGKGLYVLGLGQEGSNGGHGCVKLYWNHPKKYYQTPVKPEISITYDYYIDPGTGVQDENLVSYYVSVYNPSSITVSVEVTLDKGSITDFETYTFKSSEVRGGSHFIHNFVTSYSGTDIDWGARAQATATANGISLTSDTLIYNYTVWNPSDESSEE